MEPTVARQMYRTIEPFHGFVYLVPEAEAEDEYAAFGLPGRMGSFASRSAPMGPVPAEVVIATFYNFSPALVRRAIPEAWARTTPADLLAARLRVVDRVLRRVLGDDVPAGSELAEALALARTAAAGCEPVGRPLFAGHASRPWPDEPHVALWHALSLVREYRGDGHIAALVAEGYSGCDAIATHVAAGDIPKASAASRAWTDEGWAASEASLRARGLMDGAGGLTEAGRASRRWVEDRTDALAMPAWEPWARRGAAACATSCAPGARRSSPGPSPRRCADRARVGTAAAAPRPLDLTRGGAACREPCRRRGGARRRRCRRAPASRSARGARRPGCRRRCRW